MKPKVLFVIYLSVLILVACGPSDPPAIRLVVDGSPVSGLQGAYCWNQGIRGTVCVDPMEPSFENAVPQPVKVPITLELESPLPTTLNLSLSPELFGDEVLSEDVAVRSRIDWSPAVPPGEYVLSANAEWPEGEVTYWFYITLP